MNTTPAQTQKRAAVVYNPIKVDLEAIRTVVGHEEQASGWGETLWFPTSEDDPGQGPCREAVSAGASLVIAAGGDGTVRAVAEGLRGVSTPTALIPSGTGNLLARNLDLTLDDLEHSIHTAFTGDDREIDVGIIDLVHQDGENSTHVFVVMAGLGLDAKMLVNTDDDLKKKAGRALMTREVSALRYVKATELTVTLERPEDIELDGDEFGIATGFRTWVDQGGITIKVPAAA